MGYVGRGKSKHRPRNDPILYGGKYPFFQTSDVKNAGLYLTKYSQTYNEKGLAQSKLWKPGVLLITIAANIAETAILGIEGCFPDSIVGFIPDKEKADVKYIKYSIDQKKLQLQNISQGTTQDNLSLAKLMSLSFEVPPIEIQRKIALFLSIHDDLIEVNNKRIEVLIEIARCLYEEYFVNFRYPGHEDDIIIETEFGPIPKGWRKGKLKQICIVQPGYAFKSKDFQANEEFGIIKIANIDSQNIDIKNVQFINKYIASKKIEYEISEGDILIAMTGAKVGKVGIMPKVSKRYLLNQRVGKFIPKKDIYKEFLFMVVTSNMFNSQVKQLAQGAAQPNISNTVIENIDIVIPSDDVLTKYHENVTKLIMQIMLLRNKNFILEDIRDLLLPKLISGSVDIYTLLDQV